MPGISGSLAKLATSVPLYAVTNTNRAHHLYWSRHLGNFVSHVREIFVSYKIGLRKPDAEAFQFVVEPIGMPLSAFFSSMTFLRTSKAPEPAGFRRSL
jgi:glucose-1-phosphatase